MSEPSDYLNSYCYAATFFGYIDWDCFLKGIKSDRYPHDAELWLHSWDSQDKMESGDFFF